MKLVAVAGLVFFLAGCTSPSWTVIQQEPSNALAGSSEFAVLPIDTSAVASRGRSSDEVLVRKGFADGSAEVTSAFAGYLKLHAERTGGLRLHDAPEEASFVVRPKISYMDPGLVTTVYSRPSKLVMQVSIEDRLGNVLDIIEVESSTEARSMKEAPAERYEADLRKISRRVVEYLAARSASPEGPTL
ncbi:MAG: hypothetical protein JNL21_35085 [Myxococcales bacterium]|nr:hypothetical protein [Myxococcales bacterium]